MTIERKSVAEKKLAGTYRPSRERRYAAGLKANSPPAKAKRDQTPAVLVPKAPSTLSKSEREAWGELREEWNAQGGIKPGQLSTFRLLVSATTRLRALPEASGSYGALLGQVAKLSKLLTAKPALAASPPPTSPAVSETDVLAMLDPDDFDSDDGYPSFLPLPPFSPEFWIMDAPGGPAVKPEVIAAARKEWIERERLRLGL